MDDNRRTWDMGKLKKLLAITKTKYQLGFRCATT